jgi:hypothetical protein
MTSNVESFAVSMSSKLWNVMEALNFVWLKHILLSWIAKQVLATLMNPF